MLREEPHLARDDEVDHLEKHVIAYMAAFAPEQVLDLLARSMSLRICLNFVDFHILLFLVCVLSLPSRSSVSLLLYCAVTSSPYHLLALFLPR